MMIVFGELGPKKLKRKQARKLVSGVPNPNHTKLECPNHIITILKTNKPINELVGWFYVYLFPAD